MIHHIIAAQVIRAHVMPAPLYNISGKLFVIVSGSA